MPGLTIPSIMEKQILKTQATLEQLNDRGKWGERGIHRLGDGLAVRQDGQVILTPRSQAPSQMEDEDMIAKFQKFQQWLRSEGADQIVAEKSLVEKTQTDPVLVQPSSMTPADLSYEFGTPIDTTEIIALCEDTSLYQTLPEVVNGSKYDTWREMSALEFCSGTSYIGFTAGQCPEFICNTTDDPANHTITKKHIGVMSTLSESDIQHSIASIAAGYGVRELVGPTMPANAVGTPSIAREAIRSLMDKEIKKQQILMLNGWDYLLVKGNASSRTLEFNGIENLVTAANGARVNPNNSAYSGTFSAQRFDEWLAAGCAKPTHIFGHGTALQAVQVGYWGLHAPSSANSQVLNFTGPGRNIIPGMTFGYRILTSVGELVLVPDSRFSRTDNSNGSFSSDLYALRMVHNGEPLVYRATQIPLAFKELNPGCTAISFETWAVTALVVKHMCAQAVYHANFAGLSNDGCSYVFG